jgi:cytochrome c2
MHKIGFLLLVVGGAGQWNLAATLDGDAHRGAAFFRTQMCINCHALKGEGGHDAPDLGRRYDRAYTPAGIAALMWNHAPAMWTAITQQNLPLPAVNQEQAADLFAFFYSVRYFEKPGEAERGKLIFQTKHCSECHSIAADSGGVGPPVARWTALTDPIALVDQLWNHSDHMKGEMAARKIQWPEFTSQELDDLLVYLQNLPPIKSAAFEFILPSPEGGAALFNEKGCTGCHKGALSLENRLADSTLTDVAAALWNHSPQMAQPHPELSLVEMRQILGYVWARQFFQTRGDAEHGRKTFESKKCAGCHNDASSGAPALSKPSEPYSTIDMVSLLWKHGPAMLRKMQDKHVAWPQLSQSDMVNLIAYLNTR